MKIFDSTCIIAFLGELQEPDLLVSFIQDGYRLIIPICVYQEIIENPAKNSLEHLLKTKKFFTSIEVEAKELEIFQAANPKLGKGECETMLLGMKAKHTEKRYCCILDDRLARERAEKIGLKITGTIGLLQRLVKKERISLDIYNDHIRRLIAAGFRIDPKLAEMK